MNNIDRRLLFYKLRELGIGGKMLNSIKYLYSGCKSSVNVNEYLNERFQSNYGVRQGDALSPTLFGLYINIFLY